jgi:glycosyltransferase involved in cell wall biosynthesis
VKIQIDGAIFGLQAQGGISRLWRQLIPPLRAALPEVEWVQAEPDLFISTYYRPAPTGARSLVMIYDWIAERYPAIGASHPDAVAKRLAVKEAAGLVAISARVSDDTVRYANRSALVAECGGSEHCKRVVGSGVEHFRTARNLGTNPYLLTVGNRGLYKNVQSLYQAWQFFPPTEEPILLVQVGGEADLPQDRAFDRAFPGIRRKLTLSDADLSAAYSGAVALVYPSLFEGFGLPVVEAMSCGCVVIGGETMTEIANGALIYTDVTRPQMIATAVQAAFDPATAIHCAMEGYERAARYTWTSMAAKVAAEIRRIA